MPKFDYDLYKQGYKPIRLESVFETAKFRKPGYLDAINKALVNINGVYYLKPEDYMEIRQRFEFPKGHAGPKQPPTSLRNKSDAAPVMRAKLFTDAELLFFDLDKPCPDKPGWAALRAQFAEELEKAGGASCPGCKRNGIKHKYKKLLAQLNEQTK